MHILRYPVVVLFVSHNGTPYVSLFTSIHDFPFDLVFFCLFIYSLIHLHPPTNAPHPWHRKTQHSSNSTLHAPTSTPSSKPHRRHSTTSHKPRPAFLSTNNRSQPPPEESSLCSPLPCPEKPSTPESPELFPRRWNSSTRSSARRVFRPSW